MARRYLIVMLVAAAVTSAAVAGFTWLVDPLGIYASPRWEGFNSVKPSLKTRSRIFKTVNVAAGQWQALIVGSSRADTGFDSHHQFFRGMRTFNAGLGGESYGESLALVRAASNGGALRKVVAVLDFEVGNAYYEGAIDDVRDNYRPWRKAALALNLEMAGQAAWTLLRQDNAAALENKALWYPDGRFAFPAPERGHRAAALASEFEYLEKAIFRGPAKQYAIATASSQPLERIRELMALAYAKDIDLVLVVAPAHARQLEIIAAAGLWDELERWKRVLVEIREDEARKAGRPPFALWDFSYSEPSVERFPPRGNTSPMRWYYESSHFTPALGNRVLDRIGGGADHGFGIELNAKNIEQHLSDMRSARTEWRRANAVDAKEIEELSRRAALVRNLRGAGQRNH
jgi:hypothetical protein